MAADKKTLLRDALKQVQAGKIDKAVDTYRAIVRLDLRDAAVRNSLADLLVRQGKKKDAIAEYLEAASLYEKDGFGPRAIAICQKIVKLDGEQWGVRLKLGDLYAAQKLRAEARAIYLQLADRHDKRGEVADALEIFRRIADLDPENLHARVKLAGLFEKQKQPDQAAAEYVRAAKGYAAHKEKDTAIELLVRAFKLSPENLDARGLLARHHAERQEWQVVVGLLETPVTRGSTDADLIVLYAEALTRVDHAGEACGLLEKLQASEPNALPVNLVLGRAYLKTGELEKGAAALNRCVGAHIAENRLELAESLLQELAAAVPEDDRVLQRIIEVAQKRGDAAGAADTYLKLAAVFEKKGLVRNAVGALERYLESRPGDDVATERLAQLKEAVPAPTPSQPPAPAPAPGPQGAAPTPKAAVKAEAPAAAPAPARADAEDEIEIEIEEALDLSELAVEDEEELVVEGEEETPEFIAEPASVADARASVARGAPAAAAAYLEEHLGANPSDVEAWEALIEARRVLGSPKSARDALLRLADVHRRARRFEEARTAYKGALDLDQHSTVAAQGLAELTLEEEVPLETLPPPEAPAAAYGEISLTEAMPEPESPAPSAVDYGEISLEEMPTEVEPAATIDAIDEISRDEMSVEPADTDLVVAPIEEPAVPPVEPPEPEPPQELVLESVEAPASPEEHPETPIQEVLPEIPPAPEGGDASGEVDATLAEADFYLQQGLLDEAESLCTKLELLSPESPVVAAQLRKIREQRAAAPPPAEPTVLPEPSGFEAPAAEAASAASAGFEDFLGDLRQELEAQGDLVPPPLEEAGLNEIFQEFQRSVKAQLGDEDFETHYNLGIAYKEMGLTEEAIGEFSLAEKSATRRMDAMSMIAICLREQGRLDEAAQKLRTGVALAVEGSEQQKGLLYDLAAVHDLAGRADLAAEALQRIHAMDADYRDVAARLGAAAPPADTRRRKSKISYL